LALEGTKKGGPGAVSDPQRRETRPVALARAGSRLLRQCGFGRRGFAVPENWIAKLVPIESRRKIRHDPPLLGICNNTTKGRNIMHSKFVRTSILALSALSVGACAPVGLEKTAEIENMARQALSEARDAAEKANNALSVASEASYSATKAQSTAESALNCCNENRDKIDRALERVTRK